LKIVDFVFIFIFSYYYDLSLSLGCNLGKDLSKDGGNDGGNDWLVKYKDTGLYPQLYIPINYKEYIKHPWGNNKEKIRKPLPLHEDETRYSLIMSQWWNEPQHMSSTK